MSLKRSTPLTQQQLQGLIQRFNAGQLDEAIKLARSLITTTPSVALVHSILASALSMKDQQKEALPHFVQATQLEARIPEHHFNLGLALTGLGKHSEAIAPYQKAITLKPEFAVAHFNLGSSYLNLGQNTEACSALKEAIRLQPGYTEAWGNLGAALQNLGHLNEAIEAYQRALAIQPRAKLHISLGSALHNQGKLADALSHYRQASQLDPLSIEAQTKIASLLWSQGQVEDAIQANLKALEIDSNHAEAHYQLGVIFQEAKAFDRARTHFEAAQIHDWKARCLYCLYKSKQFDAFKSLLHTVLDQPHDAPFIATLSAHYAVNFSQPDPYQFCPNPIDHVYHGHLKELDPENGMLKQHLLEDILKTDIQERKQARLHEGIQSAGNLFRRNEDSFQQLADAILSHVKKYVETFSQSTCTLIQRFPKNPQFTSAWYIKMRKGGHLTSHIHEEGWISGSVYLAMPSNPEGKLDGSIEFSTDGDDYPKETLSFPVKVITPLEGDIVLFPSSLFHRTLPFDADQDRICIAFDIRPET